MNKLSMFAIACVLFAGCAAEMGTEGEIGEASEELRIRSFGYGETTCPGGGNAQCVACVGNSCEKACSGDLTCATSPEICAWSPGRCTTSNVAPTRGTFGAIQ